MSLDKTNNQACRVTPAATDMAAAGTALGAKATIGIHQPTSEPSHVRVETAATLQPVPIVDRHLLCEVCGNDYDKAFAVVRDGRSHVFDCFECAIHALAPTCAHCGCRILGHGMEHGAEMYCCAHCAQARGVPDLKDRS